MFFGAKYSSVGATVPELIAFWPVEAISDQSVNGAEVHRAVVAAAVDGRPVDQVLALVDDVGEVLQRAQLPFLGWASAPVEDQR